MHEPTTDPTVLRALRKELDEQLRHAAFFPDQQQRRLGLVERLRAVDAALARSEADGGVDAA